MIPPKSAPGAFGGSPDPWLYFGQPSDGKANVEAAEQDRLQILLTNPVGFDAESVVAQPVVHICSSKQMGRLAAAQLTAAITLRTVSTANAIPAPARAPCGVPSIVEYLPAVAVKLVYLEVTASDALLAQWQSTGSIWHLFQGMTEDAEPELLHSSAGGGGNGSWIIYIPPSLLIRPHGLRAVAARYDETLPSVRIWRGFHPFWKSCCILGLPPGTWMDPVAAPTSQASLSLSLRWDGGGGRLSLQHLQYSTLPYTATSPARVPGLSDGGLSACSARLRTGSSSGNSGLAAKQEASSPPSPDKNQPGP
ncbi:hypothetical protein CCMA1212_002549 [Trichoderma ghanense]|uniref:Uncharacterized protein n=1 Tax=Trichoderma ghanense TaxID=65468 RepID=A0ABY2HC69_9HYPO